MNIILIFKDATMKFTQILLASAMTITTVTAFADVETQPQQATQDIIVEEQTTAADTATTGTVSTDESAATSESAVEAITTETPAQ